MNNYKKQEGYKGEEIVLSYYLSNEYKLIDKNFTFRGGEIDLIFVKNNICYFVEVKVVNSIDDISDYITYNKLFFLKRSIETYIWKNSIKLKTQLDIVFIKNHKIYKIYNNIYI